MSTSIAVKDRNYREIPIEVYKGGLLTLSYFTRRGKFNLLSNDESFSCHIAVYENGERLISANTSPEYALDGNEPYDAMEELKREIASHWISTSEMNNKRLLKFIERYEEKIEYGNDKARLVQIDKQLTSLNDEKERIEKRLPYYEGVI